MDPGQIDNDTPVGLREQELRFFAKWSLVSGIATFGILVIDVALQLIISLSVNTGRSPFLWSMSFFLMWFTRYLTIGSSTLAVIFAILGKRRLGPDSEKSMRRKLTAGLILGIVFMALIVLSIVLSSIFYYQHFD